MIPARPCSEPKCKCKATTKVHVKVSGGEIVDTYIAMHFCDEHAKQYEKKPAVGPIAVARR